MHYPITVASLTLKSPKDEVNGLQVEVIAQRAPRLPVKYIFQLLILCRNSLKVFQPAACRQVLRTLSGALILSRGCPHGQSLMESQRTQQRPRRRTVWVSQTNSSESRPARWGRIEAAGWKKSAILSSTSFSSSLRRSSFSPRLMHKKPGVQSLWN